MRVVAAPDKFKGTATAHEAAEAIGSACWELDVDCSEVPMADGGVRNGYREPAQLGCDRFAALIAARHHHPDRDLLVVNAGTATTVDALTADGQLHRWAIVDHHPESSWRTFFGKIWYEGASGPAYAWQSSAGSDEFEPKYSLVPLFYGTVKGTFYALLFALPIALTAAVYVSQFLRPEYRQVVKPVMEVMASLPSVVLGFLAGLWLAPLVDPRLISIFCAVGILAPAALFAGFLWSALPQPVRRQVKPGMEFLWLLPFLALCAYFAWQAGPAVEAAFFTVKDTASGLPIADFREWWRQTTGETYDSRNSLVVEIGRAHV